MVLEGTLFQKTQKTLEKLCNDALILCNSPNSVEELDLYESLKNEINILEISILKFRYQLEIKDTCKQVYGPKMIKKIQTLVDKYDSLHAFFEEELFPIFEYHAKISHKEVSRDKKCQSFNNKNEESINSSHSVYSSYEICNKIALSQKEAVLSESLLKKEKEKMQFNNLVDEKENRYKCLADSIEHINMFKKCNYKDQLRMGIQLLSERILLKKELITVLESLYNILNSIEKYPHFLFLRVIRILNNEFYDAIGKYSGGLYILCSSGFAVEEYCKAFDIIQEADECAKKYNVKIHSSPKFSGQDLYLILREPSFDQNYAEWIAFNDRLSYVSSFLKSKTTTLQSTEDLACF